MAAMPENRPPTRGDVIRGALILLFPVAGLLHFGYSRAVSGPDVNDGRLAVGLSFVLSLAIVTFVVRGRGDEPDAEPSGTRYAWRLKRRRRALVVVGIAGVALGLLARGASPMWSGAYIAGLAGAVAGLATAGLLPVRGEEDG